ncbi:MAG: TIGR00270 family protein [Thermoplasmatales archaeon]|nr:MAG: TIGR00270 family protein [Thermoplasmatales archaeon]
MQCELCGRDCGCKPANVDGVRMMLCPSCMRHGQAIKESPVQPATGRTVLEKIKKPPVKDIYKDINKELVSNWNSLIKKSRENKGLSREELGFKIGERTVTIAKIENGDLRPSDKIIIKLEKELGITLFEETGSSVSLSSSGSHPSRLTLGDFIKTEKK